MVKSKRERDVLGFFSFSAPSFKKSLFRLRHGHDCVSWILRTIRFLWQVWKCYKGMPIPITHHPPSNPTLCILLEFPPHVNAYPNFIHYTWAYTTSLLPPEPLKSSSNSDRPLPCSIQTSIQRI
jgi:hypothetical protein